MEETKNKENAKLQSAIEEMEQVRVADSEKIETLTTDNEKLKVRF